MKRVNLLSLLLFVFAVSAIAQSGRSGTMLKLRLSDNALIAVVLDGVLIDKRTTALTLDGMRPGTHRLEVYRTNAARRRTSRVFTGVVHLKPGVVHVGTVDVVERGLHLRSRPFDPDTDIVHQQQGSNTDTRDHSGSIDDNDATGSFPQGRDSQQSTPASNVLRGVDMNELQKRVASRLTDGEKEQLLKNALEDRTATTEQIRQMLAWLTFESTRLDFAKWAYGRSADPRNYWKLEDVFTFSSSKAEFSGAIKGR